MLIVHPIEGPLYDALFNRGADLQQIMDKRDELIRRHKNGELLNDLVSEAKQFADRIAPHCTPREGGDAS